MSYRASLVFQPLSHSLQDTILQALPDPAETRWSTEVDRVSIRLCGRAMDASDPDCVLLELQSGRDDDVVIVLNTHDISGVHLFDPRSPDRVVPDSVLIVPLPARAVLSRVAGLVATNSSNPLTLASFHAQVCASNPGYVPVVASRPVVQFRPLFGIPNRHDLNAPAACVLAAACFKSPQVLQRLREVVQNPVQYQSQLYLPGQAETSGDLVMQHLFDCRLQQLGAHNWTRDELWNALQTSIADPMSMCVATTLDGHPLAVLDVFSTSEHSPKFVCLFDPQGRDLQFDEYKSEVSAESQTMQQRFQHKYGTDVVPGVGFISLSLFQRLFQCVTIGKAQLNQIAYQDHFVERVADEMAVLEDVEAAYKAYLGSKRRMPALEQNTPVSLFQAESEHVLRLCVSDTADQSNREVSTPVKSRLTITMSQTERHQADLSLLLLKQNNGKQCIVNDIHSRALTARRTNRAFFDFDVEPGVYICIPLSSGKFNLIDFPYRLTVDCTSNISHSILSNSSHRFSKLAEQLLSDHVISHGTSKVLELHESKGLGSTERDLTVSLCELSCGDIQLWALKSHFQRELDQQISELQIRSVIRHPSMSSDHFTRRHEQFCVQLNELGRFQAPFLLTTSQADQHDVLNHSQWSVETNCQ